MSTSFNALVQTGRTYVLLQDFPAPDLERAWRDCLARVELPAHYNSPEFFLEPHFAGMRPFAILALEQDAVVGVLTGMHEDDHVMCGLPSRPQICFDKTAGVEAAADALARGLLAEAGRASVVSVFSWSWTSLDVFKKYGFRFRQLEGDVVLDLKQGPDALFRQLAKNRRVAIREAIRRGVEVFQSSSPEDILAFYEVYRAWRRTSRKEIAGEEIPFAVFEKAYHITTNRRLFLARFSGKVIAGITLRFFPRGLLEFSNNSSLDEFLHLRPNDLLVWKAIEWGCSEGFFRYSLGGAHPFLRRFGGTVVPIYRYRMDRSLLHQHDLRDAVLDVGRETLRKMPEPLEKAIRRLLGKA